MVLYAIIIFALYLIFLGVLIAGWNGVVQKNHQNSTESNKAFLSVIIPVRNEARNIENILFDLRSQDYSDFEVIVVDDHSADNTAEVVRQFIKSNKWCRLLPSLHDGKKFALTAGIESARGSIIVTTDADCRLPSGWLSSLARYFGNNEVKFVFGSVKMQANSLFESLQSLEFASLIGSGIAMAHLGRPIMCNGANLAFRKTIFEEVRGYDDNFHIASGDDEFLMRKILQRYPGGVIPALDRHSVVSTSASITIGDFFQQRLRWAGKWSANNSLSARALAMFVFVVQLTTLLLPFFFLIGWVDALTCAVLMCLKAIAEYIFLKQVARFLEVRWNWPSFILLQVVYPAYVVAVALSSGFSSPEWKGRKLKSLAASNKFNKEILG